MQLGGPVWHCSVSPRFALLSRALAQCWEIAERELRGVGDATLGEWREVGDIAIHVRRRVTPVEMASVGLDGVEDIRQSPEFQQRVDRMRPFLPARFREMPLEAFP